MVAVPLAVGAFTREPSNQPAVILRNMMVEKDVSGAAEDQFVRMQRPGLAPFNTAMTGTKVRALGYMQGLLSDQPCAAVGTSFVKFTGTGTTTTLGTIADDGKSAQIAFTNFGVALLSGGVLHSYDTTLKTIAMPEAGEVPVSIASINSYVIVACRSGRVYWLVPGATTINPLHFFTAESMPDGLVGIAVIRAEVFLFGTQSCEVWQPTGDPDIILTRASGREWDKGLVARDTLQRFDNDAVFVGSDGIVYRVDSLPQRISNPGIEEHIRRRTSEPSAFTYTYEGHSIYALHVPGEGTFAFDVLTNEWAEYTTAGGADGWRGRTSCAFGGSILIGDSQSGKVFILSSGLSSDDGIVFERAVSGVVAFHGGRQRHDSLSVHVGSNQLVPVRMRYRDGLSAWSEYRTKTTRFPNDIVDYWRLGSARHPSRVVEFSCVANAPFRVSSAFANEARAI